jgi:hypothetical protein
MKNTHIDRGEQLRFLENLPPPPSGTKAFLALKEYPLYGHFAFSQNTGMLMSQYLGIPTLNGASGFLAPNWGLSAMKRVASFYPLLEWIHLNGIQHDIKIFDIDSNSWISQSEMQLASDFSLSQYAGIDLVRSNETFSVFKGSGWSELEPWGIWSEGDVSNLFIPAVFFEDNSIIVELHFSGFFSPERDSSSLQILVNKTSRMKVELSKSEPEKKLEIALSSSDLTNDLVMITFQHFNPKSPKELGIGEDSRVINVGLTHFFIRPISHPVLGK